MKRKTFSISPPLPSLSLAVVLYGIYAHLPSRMNKKGGGRDGAGLRLFFIYCRHFTAFGSDCAHPCATYPPFSPVVGNHSEAAEEERTDGGPLSDWPTSLFPTFYWIISLSSSTLLAN